MRSEEGKEDDPGAEPRAVPRKFSVVAEFWNVTWVSIVAILSVEYVFVGPLWQRVFAAAALVAIIAFGSKMALAFGMALRIASKPVTEDDAADIAPAPDHSDYTVAEARLVRVIHRLAQDGVPPEEIAQGIGLSVERLAEIEARAIRPFLKPNRDASPRAES
jgi:hypothetical protein